MAKSQDIRKILMVLLGGIGAAFLMTFFFISRFGPSGDYSLNAVLVEPAILTKLNYNDHDPASGAQNRYIFDRIALDIANQLPQEISIGTYQKIYPLISSDKSLSATTSAEESLFFSPPLTISFFVKTESTSSNLFDSKLFQKIEFSENHYRVLLHEDTKNPRFAYFNHPGILKKIQEIL